MFVDIYILIGLHLFVKILWLVVPELVPEVSSKNM